ncbi:Protein of unknown function, partial [Gryllus bimaculatus]
PTAHQAASRALYHMRRLPLRPPHRLLQRALANAADAGARRPPAPVACSRLRQLPNQPLGTCCHSACCKHHSMTKNMFYQECVRYVPKVKSFYMAHLSFLRSSG